MNRTIIGNFRDSTTPTDEILLLGDICMGQKVLMPALLKELTEGRYCSLVAGNHDPLPKEVYLQYFKGGVFTELEIEIGGVKVLLSHYPYAPSDPNAEVGSRRDYDQRFLERRPAKVPGRFLLHGHSHSKPEDRLDLEAGSWDIGVDANGYKPVSEDTLKPIISEWYIRYDSGTRQI